MNTSYSTYTFISNMTIGGYNITNNSPVLRKIKHYKSIMRYNEQ